MKAVPIVGRHSASDAAQRANDAYQNGRALAHCLMQLASMPVGHPTLDQEHLQAIGRMLAQANDQLFDAYDQLQLAATATRS